MWNIRLLMLALFLCSFARGQFIIDSYKYTGVNLNLANAADPVNEVDGIANTINAGGDVTVTSVESSPSPQHGSSSILFTRASATGTNENAGFTLVGLTSGNNYTVSFYAQEVLGISFTIVLPSGAPGWDVSDSVNTSAGGWTLYSLTANCTSNDPTLRVTLNSATATGDKIAIDNITVVKN